MKIEKINDNQIRCTLTREDLENHQIRISELAYGTDKAKKLFRDMKVEDPEELDTRFSKFAPFKGKEQSNTIELDGADNIIDIFQKLYEAKVKSTQKKEKTAPSDTPSGDTAQSSPAADVNLIRLYEFDTLDDVIAAAHGLNSYFTGENTLYKDLSDSSYKLVVHQSSCSPEEFNRICNILTEYGSGRAFTLSGEAFLKEHGELISESALQQLTQL